MKQLILEVLEKFLLKIFMHFSFSKFKIKFLMHIVLIHVFYYKIIFCEKY